MQLSDETTKELLLAVLGGDSKKQDCAFEVGQKVFICTVTRYFTGRITKIIDRFLFLEDSAWIADTGRYADALIKAEFGEVEPIEAREHRVNIDSIVDCVEWAGPLPKVQK